MGSRLPFTILVLWKSNKSPISGRSNCPKSPSLVQLFKSTVILHQIESSLTIGSTSETIHRHIFSPFLTGNRACVTFTVTWSSGGRLISHLNKQTVFLPWYRQMGWKGKLTWLWPSQLPTAVWEAQSANLWTPTQGSPTQHRMMAQKVWSCRSAFALGLCFYEIAIVSSPVDLRGVPLMVWTGGVHCSTHGKAERTQTASSAKPLHLLAVCSISPGGSHLPLWGLRDNSGLYLWWIWKSKLQTV